MIRRRIRCGAHEQQYRLEPILGWRRVSAAGAMLMIIGTLRGASLG